MWLAALLVVALLLAPCVQGRDALFQYGHDIWRAEQGIPHESVRAIAQTDDGFLWLATTGSLARFDGTRFTVAGGPELAATQATALLPFSDSLLVGTHRGLYLFNKADVSSVQSPSTGLNSVTALARSGDGHVWAGTEHGLFRSERPNGFPLRQIPSNVLPSGHITSLAPSRRGGVWIGTRRGLVRWADGEVSAVRLGLTGTVNIRAVYEDSANHLWVGTENHGLFREGPHGFAPVRFSNLGRLSITSITEDRNHSMWIGTWGSGVFRIADDKLESYTSTNGLSHEQVLAVFEDRDGSIWIGTRGGGLNRFRPQNARTYTTAEGLSHNIGWSVAEDRSGKLWIGTDAGLTTIDATGMQTLTVPSSVGSKVVNSVAIAPNGAVWIIAGFSELLQVHNGDLIPVQHPALRRGTLRHLHIDRSGNFWIATNYGLISIQKQTAKIWTTADGLPSIVTRSTIEDRSGRLWVSTAKGVARIEGTKVTAYTRRTGLPADSVRSVSESADGSYWFATQGDGLIRLRNGSIRGFNEIDGLPVSDVYTAADDGLGYLWLTSAKGIFRIAISEFDRVERQGGELVSLFVGTSNGMATAACTGGIQPAARMSSSGIFWVPTMKGLSAIQTTNFKWSAPPQPMVDSVIADGVLRNDGTIPAGAKSVEVQFTSPVFLTPHLLRFEYRLDGFDTRWNPNDGRRSAYYTGLPAGNYTFRLRARANNSDWSKPVDAIRLTVIPHWHETILARVVFVIGALVLASVLLWWFVDSARRRERRLTEMVEERTSELESAKVAAEHASRSRTEFLTCMSHEIRTPLNGILGLTDLALRANDPDEKRAHLRAIQNCGEILLALVNDVLDLAKVDAGRMELEERNFPVCRLMEEVVAVIGPRAREKGVMLTSEIGIDVPAVLTGDSARLRQVLVNLAGNAVKFTSDGSISLRFATARDQAGLYEIAVSDTGIGIEASVIPLLFRPFTQADASTSRRFGGTGLGLAISQRLVEQMRGRIDVQSTPGEGSTFRIIVPLRAIAETAAVPATDADDSGTLLFEGRRILVAEDNAVNQLVVRAMLERLGCAVDIVNDGAAAVQACCDGDWDAVLMDCIMPGMDGYEAARQIRGRGKNTPIVAVTANAFSEDRRRCLEAGMNDHISKPVRIGELRRVLSNWMPPSSTGQEFKQAARA